MALNEVLFLPEPVVVSSGMMSRMWQAANKKKPQTEFGVFVHRGRGQWWRLFGFSFFNLNTFSFRNVFRLSKEAIFTFSG